MILANPKKIKNTLTKNIPEKTINSLNKQWNIDETALSTQCCEGIKTLKPISTKLKFHSESGRNT